MPSGDGLLVRVKPFESGLTSTLLRALAEAAYRHGNGLIELTSRANLQFRGLRADSVRAFADTIVSLGLASADPGLEQRRSLTVSPLIGLDPGCAAGTWEMAQALQAMLVRSGELATLPPKFHFVVDGGGALPLAGLGADILLRAEGGLWRVGREDGMAVHRDIEGAAEAARRLARVAAARQSRLRPAQDEYGPSGLFALAGLSGATAMKPATAQSPIGARPGAIGLGLRFGRLDAARMAELVDRFGVGKVRLTPWRAVLLPGVADPASLLAEASELICSPADPAARIVACPGAPACAGGLADIRADSHRLEALVPASGVLHLSGCAKGCAHAGPAAITLVATGTGYDLVRDGLASDPPHLRGGEVAQLLGPVS